jgi:ligand-binding sensor domain-containing protein
MRDKPGYANVMLDDWVADIVPGDSLTFWMADYTAGLLRFDPAKEEVIEVYNFKEFFDTENTVAIRDIQKEGNYLLLATEGNGLLVFDTNSKKIVKQFAANSQDKGISSNYVKSIVTDKHSNVWLATDKLLLGSTTFNEFEKMNFPTEVQNPSVYSLSASPHGKLIISTPKNTLLYDSESKEINSHSYITPYGTQNYAVLATRDSSFFTSDEHHILQIDPVSNTILKDYKGNQVIDEVGNSLRRALRFMEDSQGTIWTIDNWGRLKHIEREKIPLAMFLNSLKIKKLANSLIFYACLMIQQISE